MIFKAYPDFHVTVVQAIVDGRSGRLRRARNRHLDRPFRQSEHRESYAG